MDDRAFRAFVGEQLGRMRTFAGVGGIIRMVCHGSALICEMEKRREGSLTGRAVMYKVNR